MSNTLSVCYTSDNNYAHILGTAIYSLLLNNINIEKIYIYILDNGISDSNKDIINKIVNKFRRRCCFIDVSKQLTDVVNCNAASYGGFSTYARIYIQRFLPKNIERLLFIDTDTLVLNSLESIMNIDLSHYVLAAVKDTVTLEYRHGLRMKDNDSYFNAGILYINMNRWRNEGIEKQLLGLLPKIAPYCIYADQDLINIVLKNEVYVLPIKYNCMAVPLILKLKDVFQIFKLNRDNYYTTKDVEQSLKNPYIIHFNSGLGSRPWIKESRHPYCNQWLKMHKQAYGYNFVRLKSVGKRKKIIKIMNKYPYSIIRFLYANYVRINSKKTKKKYLEKLDSRIFVK